MSWTDTSLGRYGALVVALAAFHILTPLVQALELSNWITSAVVSVTPLALLWGVKGNRIHKRIALVAMVPFLLVVWLRPEARMIPSESTRRAVGAVLALLMSLYYGLMIWIVLQDINRAKRVSIRVIWGGVAVYMLLGMFFGMLHLGVHDVFGDAYVSSTQSGPLTYYDHIYLSYTTLTTLGYGDIVPVHPVSRALATFEAMTGTLFVTIVIARLVAMELASRAADAVGYSSSDIER